MTASILVVFSDPEKRENWKQLLEEQGYQTVAIATGARVPNLCAYLRPDLVLIEAALPDVPGLEICRRLKEDPRNKFTPVILIEGFSGDPSCSALRASGADDVWEARPTRWEALTRIQSLLQLKTYIDEQAEAVVLSLARTIEARDSYTRGHSERLATSAVRLGLNVGLSAEQVEALRVAGIVHDVGKVAVPDSVLLKAGPLTPQETAIMRRHPVEGERICSPLKSFRRVLPIIRHHHERLDGSGYPDGLRGDAIPLPARILQIVDIYDALTTDRPYREAFTASQALATLYNEAERGWLDTELVRVFAPVAAAPKSTQSGEVPGKIEKLRHAV
ncbi:MAG: HD domain-containing phosphohydrolase [Candidatus Acidiferrales bacterium]